MTPFGEEQVKGIGRQATNDKVSYAAESAGGLEVCQDKLVFPPEGKDARRPAVAHWSHVVTSALPKTSFTVRVTLKGLK